VCTIPERGKYLVDLIKGEKKKWAGYQKKIRSLSGKTFSLTVKLLDRRPIDPPPILRMSLDGLDPEEEQ
jgi:hypothetical protein